MPDRQASIEALLKHAEGEQAKHLHQLELLLCAGVTLPGASWFDACEDELESITMYRDQIEILKTI